MADTYRPVQTQTRRELDRLARERGSEGVTFQLGGAPQMPTDFEKSLREGGYTGYEGGYYLGSPDAMEDVQYMYGESGTRAAPGVTQAEQRADLYGTTAMADKRLEGPMVPRDYERPGGRTQRILPASKKYQALAGKVADEAAEREKYFQRTGKYPPDSFEVSNLQYELMAMPPEESGVFPMPKVWPDEATQRAFGEAGAQIPAESLERIRNIVLAVQAAHDERYSPDIREFSESAHRRALATDSPYAQPGRFGQEPISEFGMLPFYSTRQRDMTKLMDALEKIDRFEKILIAEEVDVLASAAVSGDPMFGNWAQVFSKDTQSWLQESPLIKRATGQISSSAYRKELLDNFNALPTSAQWALYIGAPHNWIPLGPLDDMFKALLKGGLWTLRGTRVGPRGALKGIPDYGGGVIGQYPGILGMPRIGFQKVDEMTAVLTRPLIRGVNDAASAAVDGLNRMFPVEVAHAEGAKYGFPNEPTMYDELYLSGAEREWGTAFGRAGEGQFILTPGDDAEKLAFRVWENSNVGPNSPSLTLRKGIRRNFDSLTTLSKEMLTDVFARSHNLQKRLQAEYDKLGQKMPDYMKVGTIMAAARGGTHTKGFGRYSEVTNKVARELGGLNANWVNQFLKLVHGIDVMKMHPGRIDASTGYSPEIYGGHIRQLRNRVNVEAGPDGWNKVKHASEVVRDEYRKMLDERVGMGLVDAELAATLKQDYQWYNLIRYMDSQNFGIDVSLADQFDAMRNLGSNRVVGNTDNGLRHLAEIGMDIYDQQDDPLNVLLSAIMRHEHLMSVNEAAGAMVLALTNDAASSVLVKKKGTIVVDLTGQLLEAEGPARSIDYLYAGKTALAEQEGALYRVLADDVDALVERPGARKIRGRLTRRTEGSEVIQVWEDGKPVMYEVPAWAAENLKHLVDFDQALLERVLRIVQSPFRAAFTAYNPAFMAANWVHEVWLLAAVHGIQPLDSMRNTAHAMKNIFKEDRLLVEMTENRGLVLGLTGDVNIPGVKRGWSLAAKPGSFSPGNLREIGKKYGVSQTVKPGGSFVLQDSRSYKRFMSAPGFFKGLNAVSQALEVSSRRTLYESGINRGMTPAAAAAYAREGMVDYARWGTAVHLADAAFLYLNAGVQGSLMPVRMMTSKNPGARKRAATGLTGLVGITSGVYAWNQQFTTPENNYYDIPLRERLGGLVVMLPGGERQADGSYKPNYINILPFSRELAFLTGSTTFMLEKLHGRTEGGIGTLLSGIIDQVNPFSALAPFESQGTAMPKLRNVPYPTQIGELVSELADNYDNFRQRPIVDPTMAHLPKSEQVNPDTSDIARSLAKLLPIEPPYIDHMIQFGGVMRDVIGGADYVARLLDPVRVPQEVQDIVSQLFIISDSWPDDMVRLKQREYLNELDPSIVDLKTVDMEFKKQQRGHDTPGWSSIADRFVGDGGYERARLAKKHAITEAGASIEATNAANQQLHAARQQAHKAQWHSDQRLESGEIDPRAWRREKGKNSSLANAAVLSLAALFPDAVQVMKGRAGYSGYIEAIRTMSGLWPDEETKGEFLYSSWVGLHHQVFPDEMTPAAIGVAEFHADPTPLFRAQEEFWDSLELADQKLLLDERTARSTPVVRRYIKDMETLMPYFRVDTDVLSILTGETREGWERWLAATTQTMRGQLVIEYGLEGVIEEMRLRKLGLREIPEISEALNAWQFVDPQEALTIKGEAARLERIERVTQFQESNAQPVGAGQQP